ncbi:hypothetical protein V6N12_058182, partial [Hibiscus sabdariffa]
PILLPFLFCRCSIPILFPISFVVSVSLLVNFFGGTFWWCLFLLFQLDSLAIMVDLTEVSQPAAGVSEAVAAGGSSGDATFANK